MVVGRDPVLLVGNLAQPVFDYVALGHVHRQQVLSENPPVVYAGSLERFDFGDEGQDKGFFVVDIELKGKKRCVSHSFHKVNARPFITLQIYIDIGDVEPTAAVLKAIAQHENEIKNAIVRVQLSMPGVLETSLRDVEIYKALREAHYVTIAKEARQETCLRFGEWTSQKLAPFEALKRYLETKKVPDERQKVLLEYGEKLIWEAEQRI
jgi:exonuclease SbcD